MFAAGSQYFRKDGRLSQEVREALVCEALHRAIAILDSEVKLGRDSGTTVNILFLFPVYEGRSSPLTSSKPSYYRAITANIGDSRCILLTSTPSISNPATVTPSLSGLSFSLNGLSKGAANANSNYKSRNVSTDVSNTNLPMTTNLSTASVPNLASDNSYSLENSNKDLAPSSVHTPERAVKPDHLSVSSHSYFAPGANSVEFSSVSMSTTSAPSSTSHHGSHTDTLRLDLPLQNETPRDRSSSRSLNSGDSSGIGASNCREEERRRNQNQAWQKRLVAHTFLLHLTEDHKLFLERERYRISAKLSMRPQSLPFPLAVHCEVARMLENVVQNDVDTQLHPLLSTADGCSPEDAVYLTLPSSFSLSSPSVVPNESIQKRTEVEDGLVAKELLRGMANEEGEESSQLGVRDADNNCTDPTVSSSHVATAERNLFIVSHGYRHHHDVPQLVLDRQQRLFTCHPDAVDLPRWRRHLQEVRGMNELMRQLYSCEQSDQEVEGRGADRKLEGANDEGEEGNSTSKESSSSTLKMARQESYVTRRRR